MQLFITFLVICLSFAAGYAVPINTVRDPVPASNVTVNATWTFSSGVNITNVVVVVTNLQASQYAATGLSQNKSMGEAHVFICKRSASDAITIERYINPGGHQRPQHAGSEQGGLFTPLPSTFSEGIVTCQFNLSNFAASPSQQSNTLFPLSQSGVYYPIFAVGNLNSTGDPQYHDGREPFVVPVQLNQNQNLFYKENSTEPFNNKYSSY